MGGLWHSFPHYFEFNLETIARNPHASLEQCATILAKNEDEEDVNDVIKKMLVPN